MAAASSEKGGGGRCRAAQWPSLTLKEPEAGTRTWTAGHDSSSFDPGEPSLGSKEQLRGSLTGG